GLNRAGRRAAEKRARRKRAAGAALAAGAATFGTTAALVGPMAAPTSAATTLIVNSTDQGTSGGGCNPSPGDCTLRDALAASADGDTIVFAAGLSGDIDLLTELPVTHSVEIQGPGIGVIQLDGQSATRIFNVAIAGSGAVTISGLTLKNGSAVDGGAII